MENTKSNYRYSLFNNLAVPSESVPIISVSNGKGSFIYDNNGLEFIDFISGISVSSFGHKNKHINKAVIKQIKKHSHVMVYGEYHISTQIELAKTISSFLPKKLNSVFFTNSGTEAIEGSMKLAKRYTGRTKIISCKNNYHGSTQGALSIMGNEFFKQAFRPLIPDISFIEFNNIDSLKKIDNKTACVFIEPIQSETGYIPGKKSFMNALSEVCKKNNVMIAMDEAQSGMGRTGKMFGFEHYDFIPDILILAKALGGGFPLGAFISSKEIMNTLAHDPPLGHISTFGGHPVSCAASIAAFKILQNKSIVKSVNEKEKLIRREINKCHPEIKITGKGLMLAIHLDNEKECFNTIEICRKNGLLLDWFLFAPHAIRIAPPLTTSKKTIKKACSIISMALSKKEK